MHFYSCGSALLALSLLLSTARSEEVILQYFNTEWSEIEQRIPEVAEAGYTSLWLPPPFKGASGTYSVGFDTFDRFDLGDKDQMGTIPTKYGTKEELLSLMLIAHRFGLKVYFDNVMAHCGGPLDNNTGVGELFPSLPGFVPEDFHLVRDGNQWRKASDSINYQDEWQVLNRNPFGWDIAQEDPNTSFNPNGTTEGQDYPKWSGIRHPGQTYLYLDNDLPLGTNFVGDPVYTFADKEPFNDNGYGINNTGANNGKFDWDDTNSNGQHDAGEASEPFTDTGIDPSNPDRRNTTWGFGDGIFNMGDPLNEDVNQMLFRQVRWFTDIAKPDGFRLDAVKHVPSYFFGQQSGVNKDNSSAGYNGQIQEQFNLTRGHTDWGNHRNTVYENALNRDDALLFGEHLGAPPDDGAYLEAGMRIANDDFLNTVGGFSGIGNSLSGYDQRAYGHNGRSPVEVVAYPLSHDNNFMNGDDRPAAFQYMLTREGLPIVYTDGYNIQGGPDYFPKPSYTPFLGQFGQRWVTEPLKVRRDFVRGEQIPIWNERNIAAWEMRDKRENGSMTDSDGTVLLVMIARNYNDGQLADDVVSTFPADAHLRNYSQHGGSFTARVGNDGRLRNGEGNFLIVPSGGYFAFSWDNPRIPSVFEGEGDEGARSIEFYQGANRAPMMTHVRRDGRDGDGNYTKMIPRITDVSNLRILGRADGSAVNMLMKLDGGIDLNNNGRDNPPPKDRFFDQGLDLFTGYEQTKFVRRTNEKFAAADVARNSTGSAGSESWEVVMGNATATLSRNNGTAIKSDTGAVRWIYHNPKADDDNGTPQLVVSPNNFVDLLVKIGYTGDPDAAWVYYTTDGTSYPEGSLGVGAGSTQVASMFRSYDGNTDGEGTPTWWAANLPSFPAGTVLRYKIGVHKDGAPDRFPFSQRDIDLKKRMETQFEITGFNPTTVSYYPHNDHGEKATGLAEGFHVLRSKAFLNRSGRASIFRTQTQTFYYDLARADGICLFPKEDDTIGGSSYGAVALSDSSVTEVYYQILDSDTGNDSAGNGNGTNNWAKASELAVPSQLGNTGFTKEWRFDYQDIPSSGSATIRVRFKEASSSDNQNLTDEAGHYTTITRTVNTGFPANYRIAFPVNDGEVVDENYVMKVLFDKSLGFEIPDVQLLEEFTITIDGIPLAENTLSILRNETPTDDALAVALPNSYNGDPEFLHEVRAIHLRGDTTLTDTRLVKSAVAALPDSDGDQLPDSWELLYSLDPNNPTGIHGALGDFDHDGATNLMEYLIGSNPIDPDVSPLLIPNLTANPDNTVNLNFRVIPGRQYRVEYSDNLSDWFYASDPISVVAENDNHSWSDDGTTTGGLPGLSSRRFYRIEVSLP